MTRPNFSAVRARTAAISAAISGMPVIPVMEGSKKPAVKDWPNRGSTDWKVVRELFQVNPNINYGLLTGAKPKQVVVDVDGDVGNACLAQLCEKLGKLPETLKVITPNGFHLYYQHPGGTIPNSAGKLAEGVDVRGEAGYVVGPGSRHPNGGYYEFAPGHAFGKVSIAELPKSWAEALRKPANAIGTPLPNADTAGHVSVVGEGKRNTYLTSFAGKLWHAGRAADEVSADTLRENENVCVPPLPQEEVDGIVNSILRYPSGAVVRSDAAEVLMQAVLKNIFEGGRLLKVYSRQFWRFNGKYWEPASDHWIKGRILNVIQSGPNVKGGSTSTLMSQAFNLMIAKLTREDDFLGFLAQPKPVINCANGELWLLGNGQSELRRHCPESFLRYCLTVEYQPFQSCPTYDAAVNGIFQTSSKPKDMVRNWHELMGYMMQPRRSVPMVLILSGKGDNGKTKLMGLNMKLLSDATVCAESIDSFQGNQFSMASLVGKMLLIDDDVQSGIKLPDGFLKKISEEKPLQANPKHKDAFQFVARVLPVLLCNSTPSVGDLSKGLRRRLKVIPFTREFGEDDKDETIFDRIAASEMSGVLNRALEGLHRVIDRGWKFAWPADVEKASETFLSEANPLPGFLAECCEPDPKKYIYTADFYLRYVAWCDTNGITMKQQSIRVKGNLKLLGHVIAHRQAGDALLSMKWKAARSH